MTTTLEKPVLEATDFTPSTHMQVEPHSLSVEEPTRWLWTRATYHQAGEIGLFGPQARLELINGEVWQKMSPQGAPHALGVGLAAEALRSAFPAGFHIREEKPLVLNDQTEPMPDVMVARGKIRQFSGFAAPANAVLVLEVSESSLKFDQTSKMEAYARSGIADYWNLNQRARQLEVRREPVLLGDGQWGYRLLQIIHDDGQIAPLAASEIVIRIADLMPTLPTATPPENSPISAPTAEAQNASPPNDAQSCEKQTT